MVYADNSLSIGKDAAGEIKPRCGWCRRYRARENRGPQSRLFREVPHWSVHGLGRRTARDF